MQFSKSWFRSKNLSDYHSTMYSLQSQILFKQKPGLNSFGLILRKAGKLLYLWLFNRIAEGKLRLHSNRPPSPNANWQRCAKKIPVISLLDTDTKNHLTNSKIRIQHTIKICTAVVGACRVQDSAISTNQIISVTH